MTRAETAREIRELAHQAEELATELRSVADVLRSYSIYQRIRFWATLMAGMTSSIGLVFLIGGQARISASAYYLISLLGHDLWGMVFLTCGTLTTLCAWRWRRLLRWALICQAIPFMGLAVSFAIASFKFPEANLTAAPVYMWIAIIHGFLSDFARREFG